MWRVPPGTSLLMILARVKRKRVSSDGKGETPAVDMKLPLWAPLAPLWAKQQNEPKAINLTLSTESPDDT